MLTFKAYSERNKANKGLISVYGIDPNAVTQYLTKANGKHGFFLDAENKPVMNDTPTESPKEVKIKTATVKKPSVKKVKPAQIEEQDEILESNDDLEDKLDAAYELSEQDESEAKSDCAKDCEEKPQIVDAFSAFAIAQLTSQSQTNSESAVVEQKATKHSASQGAGIKIQKNRESKNGVTRPSEGTTCAKVWDLADEMTQELGTAVQSKALVVAAENLNINIYTVRTQFNLWRKFNNYPGRASK